MGTSFSIKFPIESFKVIEPESRLFLIGSCFSEHIGLKLNQSGFNTFINPFGILFNPTSISKAIESVLNNKIYKEEELYLNHEKRYVSFDHHGRFSGINAEKVLAQINSQLKLGHERLFGSSCIIITLGSAWVYKLNRTGEIVANCHKVPQGEFSNYLLSVSEIVNDLKNSVRIIKENIPEIKIIWTISPVKHLKDGVIENEQSKATLILAVNELLNGKDSNSYYFPAYEIVTDELRDYRFFGADHAHPNQIAIDYVWERFLDSCLTEQSIEKVIHSEKLFKNLDHKNLHPDAFQNDSLRQRIQTYLDKYPI